MAQLYLIMLKISILYYDTNKISERLHKDIVVNKNILDENKWSCVLESAKFPFGSNKLAYAYAIGKQFDILTTIGLCFVSIFPNILIFLSLFSFLIQYKNTDHLNLVINAAYPVFSAYFIYIAWNNLSKSVKQFALATYGVFLIISFIMVFVFELPIYLVLMISIFLFLCFIKGGKIDD